MGGERRLFLCVLICFESSVSFVFFFFYNRSILRRMEQDSFFIETTRKSLEKWKKVNFFKAANSIDLFFPFFFFFFF